MTRNQTHKAFALVLLPGPTFRKPMKTNPAASFEHKLPRKKKKNRKTSQNQDSDDRKYAANAQKPAAATVAQDKESVSGDSDDWKNTAKAQKRAVANSRVRTVMGSLFLTKPIPEDIDFSPACDYLDIMAPSFFNNP
jgi:hypothetical protein